MYKEQLLTVGAADWIMGRFTEFRNMVGNSRHEAEICHTPRYLQVGLIETEVRKMLI